MNGRRWGALAVVLGAVFLAAFDFNVVTIALPSIQHGLGTSFSEMQLIVAGYALSFAVLLISGGRLGDLYGRRRMYVIGMAGFTVASALCGFARSPAALIVSRVLQGAFAAVMVPQALSFIQVTFTAREQSLAYAIYGMTIGFGMIAGQVLGGLLVSADVLGLGWRPVFLVNLPVGAVAVSVVWPLVQETRAPAGLKLDPGGVLLVSAALALLLYPLIRGESDGWPPWTWVSLAAAALLLLIFVRYERWKTHRDGSPLLVLSLFRHRSFVVGLGVGLSFFSVLAPFLVLLTEYLQSGLDLPPRAAGFRFVPFAISFLAASFASARLAPRLGRMILQIGAGLMVVGLVSLMAVVRSSTAHSDATRYLLPLAGAARQLRPGRRAVRRGRFGVRRGHHAAATFLRARRGGDRQRLHRMPGPGSRSSPVWAGPGSRVEVERRTPGDHLRCGVRAASAATRAARRRRGKRVTPRSARLVERR